MIAVNCAAIPESLVESEFFGYEEGSFTGAQKGGKTGLFELANHGTLFLDEVDQLPYHIQPKLLRVLQEKEVTRIGGTPTPVDVRVIAATNKDLWQMVLDDKFRKIYITGSMSWKYISHLWQNEKKTFPFWWSISFRKSIKKLLPM